MTSVPLGGWPDNLSTLFTLIIMLVFLLCGFGIIPINWGATIVAVVVIGIIADQLFFGPFWYWYWKRYWRHKE